LFSYLQAWAEYGYIVSGLVEQHRTPAPSLTGDEQRLWTDWALSARRRGDWEPDTVDLPPVVSARRDDWRGAGSRACRGGCRPMTVVAATRAAVVRRGVGAFAECVGVGLDHVDRLAAGAGHPPFVLHGVATGAAFSSMVAATGRLPAALQRAPAAPLPQPATAWRGSPASRCAGLRRPPTPTHPRPQRCQYA
jgi:hypothetical protein